MKISKIFKKHDAGMPLPPGIKPEPKPGEEPAFQEHGESLKATSNVKISSTLNKELEKMTGMVSSQLYSEIFAKAKQAYTSDLTKEQNFIPELNPIIEKIIGVLQPGNQELVLACIKDYPDKDEYLYYHIVNTCIISLAIGVSLGLERMRLVELGVAAFVHDIGARDMHGIHKPAVLSEEDFSKIKNHPEEGVAILHRLDPGLSQKILDAVRQEHERADGSGYPKGLTSDDISEYAQIIGLADVYEAMMHDRPYRSKYTSLETIRIILKNKKVFSRKVVKALIESFGLFPVDTLVQLNTKEIGVVVKANAELVSRPIVDILIDSYGKELKQPKRINLAETPVIYIDTCVKTQPVGTIA